MSRAIALVKFDDDEVFHACYNGTSDTLYPFIIREQELKEKFDNCVFDFIDYAVDHNEYVDDPDELPDQEHCEIYIDYGDGFMWVDNKATRSSMYITGPRSYDDVAWEEKIEREIISRWVIDYFVSHRMDIDRLRDRMEPPEIKMRLISEEVQEMTEEEWADWMRKCEEERKPKMSRGEEILYAYLKQMGIKIYM